MSTTDAVGTVASPPEERGSTSIDARVIERIAARAAREDGRVTGPGRGRLRTITGRRDEPVVTARADASFAMLHMDLGVLYPAPVREVTRSVRQRVAERVEELTGITVDRVDIDVARFASARPQRRRVQ